MKQILNISRQLAINLKYCYSARKATLFLGLLPYRGGDVCVSRWPLKLYWWEQCSEKGHLSQNAQRVEARQKVVPLCINARSLCWCILIDWACNMSRQCHVVFWSSSYGQIAEEPAVPPLRRWADEGDRHPNGQRSWWGHSMLRSQETYRYVAVTDYKCAGCCVRLRVRGHIWRWELGGMGFSHPCLSVAACLKPGSPRTKRELTHRNLLASLGVGGSREISLTGKFHFTWN